ncbi:vesicle transport protein SEC20-like [Clytia hemisphaerica]|uniref:Sec20 C-terminal domain-containing protein n=1 Tax=Clytia hemisphaerica TaxID=252671 RepID=A0A7M5VFF0_9CNID
MEDNAKLPVEISIENEKLLKLELELQKTLQIVELKSQTLLEFEKGIQRARTALASLREANEKFSNSILEWDDERIFEDKLRPLVGSHESILQSHQSHFQKACLSGRARIQKLESDHLLARSDKPTDATGKSELRNRKLQKAEAATKSKDATQDLKRIALLMASQVEQNEKSNVILGTSSQQIEKMHDEYKGLTGIIALSRKLLNKYNRRELTDTLLIFFGLLLFFATVLYILSKRL